MCIVCIANNINRNVYMYLKTRIFPTTGYARVLLFMFIRRELGGTHTGCLFKFTYCAHTHLSELGKDYNVVKINYITLSILELSHYKYAGNGIFLYAVTIQLSILDR